MTRLSIVLGISSNSSFTFCVIVLTTIISNLYRYQQFTTVPNYNNNNMLGGRTFCMNVSRRFKSLNCHPVGSIIAYYIVY